MEAGTQTLICPKCGSEMRSYERNGVSFLENLLEGGE
jgi:hypothetical protein